MMKTTKPGNDPGSAVGHRDRVEVRSFHFDLLTLPADGSEPEACGGGIVFASSLLVATAMANTMAGCCLVRIRAVGGFDSKAVA